MIKENWFKEWFNSKYYHLLYKNRDESEAQAFIQQLLSYLQIPKNSKVLDLACGKGRHAVQVNEMGYFTVGVDLSEESIQFAKQFENSELKFEVGDMRRLVYKNEFDLVLNLFTSFGYFKDSDSNLQVIKSIEGSLKKGGYLILDYLNVENIKPNLPLSEKIVRGDITFEVEKSIVDNFIVKNISFEVEGEKYKQTEIVELISKEMFNAYFKKANLNLIQQFGNYSLEGFNASSSERLIMVVKK